MNSSTDPSLLSAEIERDRDTIDKRCGELVEMLVQTEKTVRQAIEYTLLAGGKRLRPLLCVAIHDAARADKRETCVDVACALECLHTYSLIHDDLPCMDDDDLRRGRPSCHRAFGEAFAVLTGDALLTLCFEIIGTLGDRNTIEPHVTIELIKTVAVAAGTRGLITGQALDLTADKSTGSAEQVERIHRYKTAALIAASMKCGAVVASSDTDLHARVHAAGVQAGQAFQIMDDVLDLEMDDATLGKTAGKDEATNKLTYPAVLGVEASRKIAIELIADAKTKLGELAVGKVAVLLDQMVERRN